ncbi:Sapep family Mn(2+)-dependent dipeptidase [Lactiplantibacillus paraxiangfangensis]|uniref:Sapep family Mn(2+)-dependent dipeptidase n=1 Tax=Lactiplantibacillus paraxiangfangensis TaxID=3076224 RepID=UPI0030C767B4
MQALRPEFEQLFNSHADDFLADLNGLLRIPSVNSHATFEAPFGIGPQRAVAYMIDLAKKMGFRTGLAGNCVGWAEAGPADAPEYFGVLGHVDVVDVENDWHYPPYQLTQVGNMMYGRGILDNKGPLLSTLIALYLIKLRGTTLKKRIRIMFGSDEEGGSRDLPHYLAEQPAPVVGITPDCKFPIVYGERGLLDVTLKLKPNDGSLDQITSISGPFDRSYLPAAATVILADGTVQQFNGKKAPSNAPDLADNVVPQAASFLAKLSGQTGQFFDWLATKIGHQYDGHNLGIDFEDAASGKLQLSLYAVAKSDVALTANFSMRYPISISEDQLLDQLRSVLPSDAELVIKRRFPSTVKDQNQPFIKRFSAIYQQDTGLDGTPVTTTGVTYARGMPNTVAFGPSFPGQKGIAHKGDEWIQYSDWQMMTEIYYDCFLAELS